MRFAKAHGTGNDFVVLPDPDGELDLTPALVVALCDRRRGIGGDGVLRVIRSAKHPEAAAMAADAEWFMDYRNSDGSLAQMCGNGVRAYARYLIESGLVSGASQLRVATRSGIVDVAVDGASISASLPVPSVGGPSSAVLGGVTYAGVSATVGNPNLVCAVADADALAALDLSRGPALRDVDFPTGANVEFVTPGDPVGGADAHVLMRVHERGAGETLSCGSGACAVAAVTLRGLGRDAGVVAIDVPGGRLTVTLAPDRCRLAGPAVVVATGDLDMSTIIAV
jgi:diaminopimelate epimerase